MKSIQEESPCPICGKKYYTWGKVSGQSLDFRDRDTGFIRKTFGVGKIPAHLCKHCGNIQLFSVESVNEET